jgi:YHS domain-containing protein
MKTKLALLLVATGLLVCSCASTGGTTAAGGIKPYPRDTCIVTGNKLGSMGPPITQVYQGREIKFCCKPCTKKFAANPAKYLSTL